MGATGFSSEEKIKILYEESLRDIREIVKQCEAVTARIEEANKPNALLAGISKEAALLVNLDKSLVQSIDGLLGTIEQIKAVNQAHIADVVTVGKAQLAEATKAQVAVFEKAAGAKSEAEVQELWQVAQKAKDAVLKGISEESKELVRGSVGIIDTALDNGAEKFAKVCESFQNAMMQHNKEARISVANIDQEIKKVIENRAPMGFWGQVIWLVIVSAMSSFAVYVAVEDGIKSGSIAIPSSKVTAEERRQQNIGANLEKKFGQFTEKEQNRINAVLSK